MVDTLVNSNSIRINPDAIKPGEPGVGREELLVRRRMSVAARERHIVDGAIGFFAEQGFTGQMRDLASAIGVTHTLVYHYFPTKQALIDRVYAEVFEGRWKTEWEQLLDDHKLSPQEKFVRFYCEYAQAVLTREFVRILVFSGLADHSITDRFFALRGERLFPRLIRETRRYRQCASRARTHPREHELLMGLHGSVFYGGIRAFVYGQTSQAGSGSLTDEKLITDRVVGYLAASVALTPAGLAASNVNKKVKRG